jgi:hypothetical protein
LDSPRYIVSSFKIDERTKRRFDAAMRERGTNMSKRLREAVQEYVRQLDEGIDNPQLSFDLRDYDLDEPPEA